MINDILTEAIHNRLKLLYPDFAGFTVVGDTFEFLGITHDQGDLVASQLLDNAPQIIADYEAAQLRSEQEKQAVFLAVDATRPIEYVSFLTSPKDDVMQWIANNGVNEAIWAIIMVLRYLVACKDRQKYQ